jgi:pimeloyl-ACP methyl ester carboxylesterase
MTRERVTQPITEQRKQGVTPVSPRSHSPFRGLPISLKPTSPEIIAAREPQPERVQPPPRVQPQATLKAVPLEPRLVQPAATPDLKPDALEAEPGEQAGEATALVKNDPTTDEPNDRHAALEAQRVQQARQRDEQNALLARIERIERSTQKVITFGRGEVSSAGLGTVLTALSTDERLEVLEGVQSAHPGVWAKLEGLPVIRWDEEWQAFNAGNAARGREPGVALESRTANGVEAPQSTAAATGDAFDAARIAQLVLISSDSRTGSFGERILAALEGYQKTFGKTFTSSQRSAILEVIIQRRAFARADIVSLLKAIDEQHLQISERLRNLLENGVPFSREELTFDAFVEQLTSFMAYSNTSDFSDLKNPTDSKGGAAKILTAFGYTATPAIHGAWGLQMMIFAPISGKAKYKETILAFRGTEAVKLPTLPSANAAASSANPGAFRKDNESEMDSATDFALTDIAYTQFDTNHALIADTVKNATRGGNTVIGGHSLGGALAQITAARFPVFQRLLTFQSPHVKAEDVDRLEAQKKLKSRNYRMNLDLVPRGGPQPRMAGEVVVFEDFNNLIAQHHTPMLSELLEQTRATGIPLTAQQAALVDAGKQPPNERENPSGNANQVWLQQMIPGREDRTLVSQGAAPMFEALNQNVVANNLLVNVLREVLLPELEKITVASLKKSGGTNALLNRLERTRRDINGEDLITHARALPFSSASKEILEAYGNAVTVFAMSAAQITAELSVNTIGMEARRKLLEVALWWKTGEQSQAVSYIIEATRFMASQDLGRWWYSVNQDGAKFYEGVRAANVTPRYL